MNNFNIIYKDNEVYKSVASSNIYFSELPLDINNKSFIEENYDLLYGTFPKSYNELVLIVNSKNEIDKNIFDFLSIKSSKVSFDDIVGKQLKIVNNDDYYNNYEDIFIKKKIDSSIYNNSNNITLKIVGIIRGKKDNELSNIVDSLSNSKTKIGYFNMLTDEVIKNNKDSKIVNVQKNSSFVSFMGNISFLEANITKEEALTYLNNDNIPISINIYPSSFKNKDKIIKYLDNYNKDKNNEDKILYNDYAKTISDLSTNIIDSITIILIAFSSISLIVSSIMIGIITYISVLERVKEIGILRSLGARKKDITRVFNSEVLIIGLSSGLIAILITKLLLLPVNKILYKLTNLNKVGILSFKHSLMLILISVILTLIGGFIPAKKASKKDPAISLRSQ